MGVMGQCNVVMILLNFDTRVNEAKRKAELTSTSSISGTSKLALSGGYFRLDQHQDQLIFCSDAEIQTNPRFQMIQLRRAKVIEFKNYRMIPILDKEVPKGQIGRAHV